MNKDSSDFMLTEYERISTAYFGLRDQVNEWFKAYLTLVGFPLTVLAAVLKLGNGGSLSIDFNNLPVIVSALLIIVSLLGLFVTLTIVAMRMEMILYARTINGVRRYFGQQDQKVLEYFILPISDVKPPFYEAGQAMYWQVLFIGFLDGAISVVGIKNLATWSWGSGLIFGILVWILHWGLYRFFAYRREIKWKIKFDDDNVPSNI